jgi:hypothetical protein
MIGVDTILHAANRTERSDTIIRRTGRQIGAAVRKLAHPYFDVAVVLRTRIDLSTEPAAEFAMRGSPTTIARHLAREIATLIRARSRIKRRTYESPDFIPDKSAHIANEYSPGPVEMLRHEAVGLAYCLERIILAHQVNVWNRVVATFSMPLQGLERLGIGPLPSGGFYIKRAHSLDGRCDRS